MEFIVRCYHNDGDDNVIGAEVVVYDGDDEISKIILTDETKLNELARKLDNLDSTYVDVQELQDILTNSGQSHVINASLFNGMASDVFLKKSDITTYTFRPASHASTSTTYGVGNTNEFGHVKIIDDTTHERYIAGEALSAHQGYELNRRLREVETNDVIENEKLHSRFNITKRNGVATLTIDNWDISNWVGQNMGVWFPVFTLPDSFKPVIPVSEEVKNIYGGNIFDGGNNARVRINCRSGEIQARVDRNPEHTFYSHLTWITRE